MIHTALMFLAPDPGLPVSPPGKQKTPSRMARRHTQPDSQTNWKESTGMLLSVLADSLGLVLFLTGLWLVLRLAEVLLS